MPSATTPLDERSIELRKIMIRTLESSRRGHLGAAFSLVEILRVLYDGVLRFDSCSPRWPERDRFILSKGHGCLALYAILSDKGFFPESELSKFCQSDGILGGHPERKIPGVEASTGSLGHGLSIGIGMALNARFEQMRYRVFVVIGDGESNEGSVWEAALCAGKHRLDNLTVLVDYNKHQSYSSTEEVQSLEPIEDKWTSFGFGVTSVDGHSVQALASVLKTLPVESGRPNAIICHTVKGRGISFAENEMEWHHKSQLSDQELHELWVDLGTIRA